MTAEQKERLQERDRIEKEAGELFNKGQWAKAAAKLRQMLAIELEVYRGPHEEIARSHDILAMLAEKQVDWTAARKARLKAVAVRAQLYGAGHWRVTDARLALEHTDGLAAIGAEARRRLEEADQQESEGTKLYSQGKHADALKALETALGTYRELLGDVNSATATCLANVALTRRALSDFATAESLFLRAADIRLRVFGEHHPRYASSLNNLGTHYNSLGEYAKAEPYFLRALVIRKATVGEKDADYAMILNNLAGLYRDQGKYVKAEPLYQQALETYQVALGDKHPRFLTVLNNLGYLYEGMGEYAKAEELLVRAVKLKKEVLGEKHLDCAFPLNNLGLVYRARGAFNRAETCFREALAIRKAALGETHPDYATSLSLLGTLSREKGDMEAALALHRQAFNIYTAALGEKHPRTVVSRSQLGDAYMNLGDFTQAEPILRRALGVRKQVLGEKHPDYAHSLRRLGTLYELIGDKARAEPLLRRALEVRRNALGEKHPDYAHSLMDLGELHQAADDFVRAEACYREALEILKNAVGDNHRDYAECLRSLALLYVAIGDPRAERQLSETLAIRKQSPGDKHPNYATSLIELARFYDGRGEFDRAAPLLEQALAIYRRALGEGHPACAVALVFLAQHEAFTGNQRQAEGWVREAMALSRRNFERTAAGLSEQQQLAYRRQTRGAFNTYVCLTADSGSTAEEVYTAALAWKTPVSLVQRAIRQSARDERMSTLVAELEQSTRLLAARSRANPDPKAPGDLHQELETLSRQVDDLQQQLAKASDAFRQSLALRQRTAADIRRSLPEGTALVDFVAYDRFRRPASGRSDVVLHIAAFVIRPGRPVLRVELGPAEAVTKAVDAWRQVLSGASALDDAAAAAVRGLVWQPIETHLDGVRAVLICPGGDLARVPWGALPGREPGRYLLEEQAVATVPVPQLLPELLAPGSVSDRAPSLLLVGDVNFEADPGSTSRSAGSAQRASAPGHRLLWAPLPGTRTEVLGIQDSFRVQHVGATLTTLQRDGATEDAVRRQAGRHRYLHFATHGYFAPPQLRAALAVASRADGDDGLTLFARKDVGGFHPGLLSGLVFAGANRPLALDGDDGVLTALEVAALDLSAVDLVTLSACETGLGQDAAGEGLLGLERAFQIAGARSVVASLWKVDDAATQQLMARFYENLWTHKMGRLEAMRQAQLSVLYDVKEGARVRGLDVVPIQPTTSATVGRLGAQRRSRRPECGPADDLGRHGVGNCAASGITCLDVAVMGDVRGPPVSHCGFVSSLAAPYAVSLIWPAQRSPENWLCPTASAGRSGGVTKCRSGQASCEPSPWSHRVDRQQNVALRRAFPARGSRPAMCSPFQPMSQ
ncbi:MAG: tetratricopeptide repeat protein [Gemmataceae bacterium]|nr:tetratricopeptide repeat protein [Gemmataceae bacterium]